MGTWKNTEESLRDLILAQAESNETITPASVSAALDAKLADEHLCNKCVAILCKNFPLHPSVVFIIQNLAARGSKPSDNPEWSNV